MLKMDIYIIKKMMLFVFSILTAFPFLMKAPHVKTVDNVDYFTLRSSPDTIFYNEFKSIFGNDEFFIIAFKKDEFFTRENLNTLKKITKEIELIKDVREVKSLANIDETIGEDDFFSVRKFLKKIPEKKEDLEALKNKAVSNPLYSKNFISADGKTGAVAVWVYDRPQDGDYRKRIVQEVEKILEKYANQTGKTYLAGWTTTNLCLSQFMKKDISVFIPVSYLFITLAVFIFFRSLSLTLIAVLNISICMGSTMGLFALFDITLNNVTTIVPPVVMALALCDTVHIFSGLDKDLAERLGSKEKAVSHVLKKLIMPCFLTTATTAAGFASLYISDIPPIRDFAVIASIGMFFEFFFAFTFLPLLLIIFPEKGVFLSKKKSRRLDIFLGKISEFVIKNFKKITLTGFFLIFISVYFALGIKVETNLFNFFKEKSIVQTSNRFVENNLAGIATLDISVKSDTDNAFKEPENLKYIEKLQKFIDSIEGVDKTLSFVDFIKDMNKSFHNEDAEYYTIPFSREMTAQYLLIYDSDEIEEFIASAYSHARISVRLSKHSTMEHEKIIAEINDFIKTETPKGFNTKITGRAFLDVKIIDSLVSGQIYSLLTASVIIIFIMFFVLKSFILGSLSILPNLFPIVLNFGIMGMLNIPLNTATALIAAVAIGIAVDDTIHFLTELKNNLSKGVSMEKAVEKTILSKGKAFILSSLILCIGFGVMIFSSFVPTVNFGFLSAFIMITAIIGDIFILPSTGLVLAEKEFVFIKRSGEKNG